MFAEKPAVVSRFHLFTTSSSRTVARVIPQNSILSARVRYSVFGSISTRITAGASCPFESINAVEHQVDLCHHLTPVLIVLTREMSQTHTTDLITLTEYGTLRADT